MKLFRFSGLIAIVFLMGQCTPSSKHASLKSEVDTLSYCLGYNFGKNMKENGKFDSLNLAVLNNALADYYANKKPIMESTQMDMYVRSFMMRRYAAGASENKKKSDAFMLKNKSEKGVVETPSGLQYIIMKEGSGMKPRSFDTVEVAYKGYQIDGTVFDSTSVNNPRKFLVKGIIPGWSEALQMMSPGAKYKLFLPPHLGYGEYPPQGTAMKPNDVLIFEVELMKVMPGKEVKAMPVKKGPVKK